MEFPHIIYFQNFPTMRAQTHENKNNPQLIQQKKKLPKKENTNNFTTFSNTYFFIIFKKAPGGPFCTLSFRARFLFERKGAFEPSTPSLQGSPTPSLLRERLSGALPAELPGLKKRKFDFAFKHFVYNSLESGISISP